MHPSIVPKLEEIGYEVDYRPESSRADILQAVRRATGLIIRNKTYINLEILDHGPNLRFIARAGAGMDLIDTTAVLARNILLLNAPEGNRVALAEHALGMLLGLLNRIIIANQEVKKGIWDRKSNRGVNIEGKTIGIIGYGQMGSAFDDKRSGAGVVTDADADRQSVDGGFDLRGQAQVRRHETQPHLVGGFDDAVDQKLNFEPAAIS